VASRSWNEVRLIGNVTRDAEVKFTPSGAARVVFSLATNRRYKQGEEWRDEVCFHNIVHWGGENIANFLTKGKQVAVSGRISNRSYEKDGAKVYVSEIVAEDILLLGGKQSDEAPVSRPRGGSAGAGPQKISENLGISDDDVPF
jgi:single-strand DNA-binding protein